MPTREEVRGIDQVFDATGAAMKPDSNTGFARLSTPNSSCELRRASRRTPWEEESMSELSDLSELLTGAIVAQASVTRVVHADQLDEIRAALTTSLEAIPANCEVGRGAVMTYLDALDSGRPEGPSNPPPPFASATPR